MVPLIQPTLITGRVIRSRLFIDRLTVTMPLPEAQRQGAVIDTLDELVRSDVVREAHCGSKLLQYYIRAFLVPMSGGKNAVIQLAPYDSRRSFLRMDFNPCRPTEDGEHPMEFFQFILREGWANLRTGIESEANFTRIDFAVEFQNVHMQLVDFFHATRPAMGRVFSDENGTTTGRYIGQRTSNRHAVLYNKKIEAKKHHAYVLRGERTRLEVRCANVGPISALDNMPNPFTSYVLFLYPTVEDRLAPTFRNLLASCRSEGAQRALLNINSKPERAKCRKFLLENSPQWYNPHAIWMQRGEAIRIALDA